MGSIFGDPVVTKRPVSKRQANYFKDKKTDRKRVQKIEQEMQIDLCSWLKETFPGLHFRSDTGSGAFNSKYEKDTHNKMQSGTAEPDLMIFAAKKGYHGLLLELKAPGVNIKKKRDGTKIIVRKDSRGRIVERDYKIRLKGDWSSLHIENQARVLADYQNNWGYCTAFAVGLEHAKKIVCWYFDIPYVENQKLF